MGSSKSPPWDFSPREADPYIWTIPRMRGAAGQPQEHPHCLPISSLQASRLLIEHHVYMYVDVELVHVVPACQPACPDGSAPQSCLCWLVPSGPAWLALTVAEMGGYGWAIVSGPPWATPPPAPCRGLGTTGCSVTTTLNRQWIQNFCFLGAKIGMVLIICEEVRLPSLFLHQLNRTLFQSYM